MKNPQEQEQAVTKKAILLNKSEQDTLRVFLWYRLEELDALNQDTMSDRVW